MENHQILTRSLLETEYVQKGKTQRIIAHELGVSQALVQTWVKRYGIQPRSPGRKKYDVKNKKFGFLTVLEEMEGCDKRHPAWKCQCDCGEKVKVYASELIRGSRVSCPKCSGKRMGDLFWKGYGEISGHFWSQVRANATLRGMTLDITIKQAWLKFITQNRRCAITGIKLVFHRRDNTHTTASLDRIDSSCGYFLSNVQWVHKVINRMKTDLTQDEFVVWCCRVALNAESHGFDKWSFRRRPGEL